MTLALADTLAAAAVLPAMLERRPLLTRSELATLPQPSPLITDTLDARTVAVLAGRRGSAKSLLALDWACCLATGKPWQSREVVQGSVLWIAAEGAYGLHQRVSAWEQAWRRRVPDRALLTRCEAVNLFSGRGWDELLAEAHQVQPALVVVDTWARCTVGARENDNSDATLSTTRLEALRQLGATTLVVAHSNADDTKTRGATALEDNVDTVYRTRGEDGRFLVERTKRKDGPEPDVVHLKLRQVAQSVVLESAGGVDTGTKADAILSIFGVHFGDTGASKSELREVCREAGIASSGTFTRGLNALVSSGALHQSGTDARRRYTLGGTHAA